MENQTVIVTGASTGIGNAITRLFLEKGFNVIMNSSNISKLESAHASFGSPRNAILVAGNISDKAIGQKLVKTAVDRWGSVDVLVNNAGIFSPKPFLEVEEKDLNKFLDINLKGTFYTSQAAIEQMLLQENGAILNIGTVLVDHAIAGFPATAPLASKGAIHALTRSLAAEFGKHNIRSIPLLLESFEVRCRVKWELKMQIV